MTYIIYTVYFPKHDHGIKPESIINYSRDDSDSIKELCLKCVSYSSINFTNAFFLQCNLYTANFIVEVVKVLDKDPIIKYINKLRLLK